jgi:hypothetical protein
MVSGYLFSFFFPSSSSSSSSSLLTSSPVFPFFLVCVSKDLASAYASGPSGAAQYLVLNEVPQNQVLTHAPQPGAASYQVLTQAPQPGAPWYEEPTEEDPQPGAVQYQSRAPRYEEPTEEAPQPGAVQYQVLTQAPQPRAPWYEEPTEEAPQPGAVQYQVLTHAPQYQVLTRVPPPAQYQVLTHAPSVDEAESWLVKKTCVSFSLLPFFFFLKLKLFPLTADRTDGRPCMPLCFM